MSATIAEALKASEARYRQLFDWNPSPIFVFDKETLAFLDVNHAALDHYGYSRDQFLSKTILDIRPEEDSPILLEDIKKGLVQNRNHIWRHRKCDGTIIHVRVAAHDLMFESRPARLAVIDDVSEQQRLAEQLRQSQKMGTIGRLAGGVAHDFNNILTIISGHVAVLLDEDMTSRQASSILEIQKAAERASGLTRQLLAFSRKEALQSRIVNPNRVVKSACEMIVRLIGEDIRIRTLLSPDVTPVRVHPAEMEQVLMNLAVNARDAMPEGGTFTIRTEMAYLDESREHLPENFNPGDYVVLSIEDTGCGMDEATKCRIFEPFFTTKAVGCGTGLGLSTVYEIVKQSGGFILVDSRQGSGTTFRIYLESVDGSVEQAAVVAKSLQAGCENILLVEDNDMVRDIMALGLKRLGYNVIAASDAGAAVKIGAELAGPIDVLLTDVIMPDMNGVRLATALKAARPDIQVLFMSGYTDDALLECGLTDGAVNLLHKPFTFEQLHTRLRDMLDSAVQP